MFEKFTERSRKVLSYAQDEAQGFNHNYIGTEHLLMGLMREHGGLAVQIVQQLGVKPADVYNAVVQIIGRGDRIVLGEIGLTPRSKRAMQLAVDEARQLNHHYVGTEHLLLGLIREGEGIAAGVLETFGITYQRALNAFNEMNRTRTSGFRFSPVPEESNTSDASPAASEPNPEPNPEPAPEPAPAPSGPKNNVVTCRLDDAAVNALDALVEAGIRSTRSDAAAWLINAGIEGHRKLFDRVNATVGEIRKLRLEAQNIARQVVNGGEAATPDGQPAEKPGEADEGNAQGEVQDPEEPEDLDDLGRLDEPPSK